MFHSEITLRPLKFIRPSLLSSLSHSLWFSVSRPCVPVSDAGTHKCVLIDVRIEVLTAFRLKSTEQSVMEI